MFGGTSFVDETEKIDDIRNKRNRLEAKSYELEYEIKQFEDRWISEEKWNELCAENDYLRKTLEMFTRVLSDEDNLIDLANQVRRYPNESILSLFKEAFPEIYEELE